MPLPLVSLIIPTLNRLGLLVQTIRSVNLQDYKNLEIIISDNGSDDGTQQFLKQVFDGTADIIIRPFTVPLEMNVTDAARRANGKYIIILSDDDLISTNYISTMVAAFESDETIQVGLGRRILIDGETSILHQADPLSSTSHAELAEDWMIRYFSSPTAHNQINTVFSTFYRRAEWLMSGGQPTVSGSFFSDTIPFIGVNNRTSKIFYAPEAVFLYRMHRDQSSQQLSLTGQQKYLGMFQFFERLKPSMGDFAHSEKLRSAIINYIIMMFFGSASQFAEERSIDPPRLSQIFWEYMTPKDPLEPPSACHLLE